jgi:VanZ family protein
MKILIGSPSWGHLRNNPRLLRLQLLLLVGLISVSLLPLRAKQYLGTAGRYHSCGHIVLFALPAFALSSAWKRTTAKLTVVASVAILAILLELAQTMLYGSAFEWYDLGTDTLGIVIGSVLSTLLKSSLDSQRTSIGGQT